MSDSQKAFSFGTNSGGGIGSAGGTGFSFASSQSGPTPPPTTTATATTASSGFSFGTTAPPATATTAVAPNFSFSKPAATTASGSGFSFGGATATSTPAAAKSGSQTNFSDTSLFGATPSKPTGGLFGATLATTAGDTLVFGGAAPKPTGGPFAAPTSTPATTAGSFGAALYGGAKPAVTTAPFTGSSTGFSLGTPTTTSQAAAPSLSFGGGISKPVTTATTMPAPSFPLTKFVAPTTTAPTSGGILSSKPKPDLKLATTAPSTATTNATSTTSSILSGAKTDPPKPTTITWAELEQKISRWNTEIEQQAQTFIKQATQVNAWTGLLLTNGEKISELNDELHKVKKHQASLDHELDRVASQQNDLEAILGPLEDAAKRQKNMSSLTHNVDSERERTYALAGSVDAQIKALAAELREVIERVNSQHGDSGNSLVSQVTHILSSHTDALQWVEEESASLQRRLEQVSRGVEAKAAIH